MKKTTLLIIACCLAITPFISIPAHAQQMDEAMLKCLMSGICPNADDGVKPAGVIDSISGDVEYSTDGGLTHKLLVIGETIKVGYLITTGDESYVKINFGFGTLILYPASQTRIQKFSSEADLRQMQVTLSTGAIRAKVSHTDAIRSDFSVYSTVMANASIRNSDMQVVVTAAGEVTVSAIEDNAYVKGRDDATEITVPESSSVTIGSNEKVSTPTTTAPDTIKSDVIPTKATNTTANASPTNTTSPQATDTAATAKGSTTWIFVAGGIVIVGAALGFVFMKKRKN